MNKTQIYYNQNNKELIERYNSATLPQLNKLLKKHIQKSYKVLDIGFGSDRDLRFIHSLGAECWGVDATEEFVTQLQKEPYFKNRLSVAKLPLLKLPYVIKFVLNLLLLEHFVLCFQHNMFLNILIILPLI